MNKLEIKHLAPYLPYGLKYQKVSKGSFKSDPDFVEIKKWSILDIEDLLKLRYKVISVKPILRPLLDLQDYFNPLFNSENPDVYEYLSEEYLKDYGIEETSDILNFSHEYLPYGLVNLLIKHHFDVFELIDKNLAIDINTLN